jgi:peptidoglycan glycosyltransferase
MTCTGSERYGTGSLWCSFPGGKLAGLGHALGISCNVAFANLGARIGRAAVIEELRRYGFDGADSPGTGRIARAQGDARQLADLSVGLEATEITPAHAARMAALFGNGGSMPGVFLVVAEDGAMGSSPRPLAPPPSRRVLEPAWIPVMRAAMAPVTGPGGTAEGVAPASFPVAMKTGTASTPGLGYHVNYIGVGPLPDPSLAFCVRVTHQHSSSSVNVAAREVLGGLLMRLAATRP